MKLYLVSRDDGCTSLDTYDSFVVAAESLAAARDTHPSGHTIDWKHPERNRSGCWVDRRSDLTVTCIGEARHTVKPGVVIASFNAA
jgi:hypothetical protein